MQYILFHYLMRLVGTPYRWGGDDAIDGFDCSGLAIEFLTAGGILPFGYDSTADGLCAYLKTIGGQRTSIPKLGSLVFYGVPKIIHVGIALDKDLMIEAGGGKSTTVDLKSAANDNAFIKVRPINYRKDLNQIVHPPFAWG